MRIEIEIDRVRCKVARREKVDKTVESHLETGNIPSNNSAIDFTSIHLIYEVCLCSERDTHFLHRRDLQKSIPSTI